MLKQLVRTAIEKLGEVGVWIRSITCDGCSTNIKCLQLLGFKIFGNNLVTHIKHSTRNSNIYCIG